MKDKSNLFQRFYLFVSNSPFFTKFINKFISIIKKNNHIYYLYIRVIYKLYIYYKGYSSTSMNTPIIMIDSATKFHDYIYIFGWFYGDKKLELINVISDKKFQYKVNCNIPHNGVLDLGIDLGFSISILCNDLIYPDELSLDFIYGGKKVTHSIKELIESRLKKYDMSAKLEFDTYLSSNIDLKILDIGGRDRSKIDRSKFYSFNHEVVVMDIAQGDNVDVVGDAHALSAYFLEDSFDVLVSTSVFEHLHSPWKVAVEMNKILKNGGIALVQTHQTLGMHDIPWDFWRFSDEAWKAIFNAKTGFEILKTNMSHESYILPFLFRRDKIDAEKSAGFELSTVLVKKIGNSSLDWEVSTNEICKKNYPMEIDGFNPDTMTMVFK